MAEHGVHIYLFVHQDIPQAAFSTILRQNANLWPINASSQEKRQMLVVNVSHLVKNP